MEDETRPRRPGDGPESHRETPKSYGNIDEHHWTRTRSETNREAIDYYRERSAAPGVAEGGAERNFYCMECDGVIPFDHEAPTCPHCDARIEGLTRRYFNWVEIDQPVQGDFRAVLPFLLGGLVLVALLAYLLWRWTS